MELPSIVRMKREDGQVRAFQVRQSQWEKIVDSNHQLNLIAKRHRDLQKGLSDDDMQPEMEAVKYCLWMNPDRASAFFSNNVLLVEGPTEQALLTRLISEGKITPPPSGLYVLDCMGKYNMHRFINILSHLGTSHAVLYDDDNGKSFHPDIHRLIEETRHPELTCHIEQITQDLETMLGLTASVSKHRKPQHVMFLYSTGQISDSISSSASTMMA